MEGNILNSDNEIFFYERIKDILEKRTSLEIHPAIPLIELLHTSKKNNFNKEEMDFIMRPSRVDFAVTTGYGRRKITFAFESDSASHDTAQQKKRDKLKDEVLKKSGIPLMRFRPEIHYLSNKHNEIFVDAVLLNIANQEFVKALGIHAWEDAQNGEGHHPVCLVLPFEKEFENLIERAEETAEKHCEDLMLSEEWHWEDETNGVSYNRQSLLKNEGKGWNLLTAATGRCSDQEFVYGAYAAAERFAKLGCLHKYLVNRKTCKPEKRLFSKFIDDRKNRVPEELLNPPPW